MYTMGSSCSRHAGRGSSDTPPSPGSIRRNSLRHSVVTAIPDFSITTFYPVEDNYVNEPDGRRSPKTLAELATDALCRSLPYLDGELPSGLPQDVVDDISRSLVKHYALNATTLRLLRNCELEVLSLAGCRGVTDDWLVPLSSCSSLSTKASPDLCPLYHDEDDVESMDLEENPHNNKITHQNFYGKFVGNHNQDFSSSPWSTPSYVSSNSNLDDATITTETFADDSLIESPSTPTMQVEGWMVPNQEAADKGRTGKISPICESPTISSSVGSSITRNLTLLDLQGSQCLTDRGLLQLADLSCLEVAKLDNCHSLVGSGLLVFSSSHRLHTLSLASCRRLTDEAIVNISHLRSLEALSLDGCRCLTNRSLSAIAGLYALRKLDLSQCDLITDDGLDHFEKLELLEELSLGWCRLITNAGINNLTTQNGRSITLSSLRLARCAITDEGVSHLGRLLALKELDLNGCSKVGSEALGKTLKKLKDLQTLDVSYCPGILRSNWQEKINKLKSLDLAYSGVRDSHLTRLTHLPTLEELNLDSCPMGDLAIGHLADNDVAPNLTSLDLADTDLTDLGMVHIAKFRKLTRLSLFYCGITNSGLQQIAQLKSLEALNLDSREISDEGLKHLRKLNKLKSLDLFSGRITDSGCAHIAAIKSLESLELCGGGIGDSGCALLATLENLQSLNLSQNERISNRGAAALAALSNLKALNLSNTRVNSSSLCFFSGLLKLQSLAFYGCRGIENGRCLDRLQSGLPNLKCIRLNRALDDDDGIVVSSDSDDEDHDMI